MIETFFGSDTLGSAQALLVALFIGFGFGFALERAGFGSSRRLAGIFYFRDMTVLKVMFSALLVAMIGLGYAWSMGWISADQVYFMPSIYGAQVVGGLLFGVGFVVGAWCPGTAAVGVASGKVDALVFLGGATVGSIIFGAAYPAVKGIASWGESGVHFLWDDLGMSLGGFAVLFTLVAIGCFWGAEYIERRVSGTGTYLGSPFLKAFSVALVVLAGGLLILPSPLGAGGETAPLAGPEAQLLSQIEEGADHVDPEELADRLMAGEADLLLVDLRTPEEYAEFHIRGAVNMALGELEIGLAPHRNRGTIVLYSNGMTHPAQARDALQRSGHRNAFILTDGLAGFMERCLKPVSLRAEPLAPEQASRVNAWRRFFAGGEAPERIAPEPTVPVSMGAVAPAAPNPGVPPVIEPAWLAERLGTGAAKIIDSRTQPAYNGGHMVRCRTGHQASQTYFVLKRVLGYTNVLWYDAGWSEWAARPELPVATGRG